MKKLIVSLVALAVLTACAEIPKPEPVPAHITERAQRPTICTGEAQCDLYWQRAAFYVNTYAPLKIQTMTDTLIQTFNTVGGDTRLWYNVSKEPLGNGQYRLWLKLGCDNMFGCTPGVMYEIARMKDYIETGELNK